MPKIHDFPFLENIPQVDLKFLKQPFSQNILIFLYILWKNFNQSKNDKKTFQYHSRNHIFRLNCTYGPRIRSFRSAKIVIFSKKYFAYVFIIYTPLTFRKDEKIHDHHYHKMSKSFDSYRQCLLKSFILKHLKVGHGTYDTFSQGGSRETTLLPLIFGPTENLPLKMV